MSENSRTYPIITLLLINTRTLMKYKFTALCIIRMTVTVVVLDSVIIFFRGNKFGKVHLQKMTCFLTIAFVTRIATVTWF